MMFVKNNNEDKLEYVCKNCNNHFIDESSETVCIQETILTNDSNTITFDKNIKYDPTLPKVNFIKCPNENCKTDENNVIYLKTNFSELNFTYFCCDCETFWNKNEK
jgi:DNA-directed RNA polymerase subunit M/transcription elongation factor TFIIS